MNIYERRRENSALRMKDNAACETLSKEQHEAIAEICRMRHELHCNLDSLLISESCNFTKFNNWIMGDDDNSFHMILKNVGIDNELIWSPEDLPVDDSMWSEFYSEYDEFYNTEYDVASNIHIAIENLLRKIDKEHGTSYAPTGATRLL